MATMQTATQAEQTNVIDPDDIDNTDAELIEQIKAEGVKCADRAMAVCDAMIEGSGMSLIKACKKVGNINSGYFCRLVSRSQTLRQQYVRARETMLELKLDEMRDVAEQDFPRLDDGRIDPAAVQLARIQGDRLQWEISKVLPKVYGDKLELYGDQANPIVVTAIERRVVDHRPERQALPVDADVESSEQSTEQIDAQ